MCLDWQCRSFASCSITACRHDCNRLVRVDFRYFCLMHPVAVSISAHVAEWSLCSVVLTVELVGILSVSVELGVLLLETFGISA